MMNSWRRYVFLLPLLMVVLQGCSSDVKQSVDQKVGPKDKIVSELKAGLAKSQEVIRQRDNEIKDLRKQLDALEYNASELKVRLADAAKAAQTRTSQPSGGELEPTAKVELLGAKALAEFRAVKLSRRVDNLSKELRARERELQSIKQDATEKEKKLQELSERVARLQTAENARVSELSKRLEKMQTNLSERAEETAQLRKSVQEKSAILDTFKTAIADSKKLKEAAESEAARLGADKAGIQEKLTAALNEIEESKNRTAQLTEDGEKLREEIEQCRLQAEELRSRTQRAQEETETLKARLEGFESHQAASQPEVESEPEPEPDVEPVTEAELAGETSNIDKILQVPRLDGSSDSDEPMY